MKEPRICRKCGEPKTERDFYKNNHQAGTFRADCMDCNRKYNRERYYVRKGMAA